MKKLGHLVIASMMGTFAGFLSIMLITALFIALCEAYGVHHGPPDADLYELVVIWSCVAGAVAGFAAEAFSN